MPREITYKKTNLEDAALRLTLIFFKVGLTEGVNGVTLQEVFFGTGTGISVGLDGTLTIAVMCLLKKRLPCI